MRRRAAPCGSVRRPCGAARTHQITWTDAARTARIIHSMSVRRPCVRPILVSVRPHGCRTNAARTPHGHQFIVRATNLTVRAANLTVRAACFSVRAAYFNVRAAAARTYCYFYCCYCYQINKLSVRRFVMLLLLSDYQIVRAAKVQYPCGARAAPHGRPCGLFCPCGVRADVSVRRRTDSSKNLDGRHTDAARIHTGPHG